MPTGLATVILMRQGNHLVVFHKGDAVVPYLPQIIRHLAYGFCAEDYLEQVVCFASHNSTKPIVTIYGPIRWKGDELFEGGIKAGYRFGPTLRIRRAYFFSRKNRVPACGGLVTLLIVPLSPTVPP